MLWHALMACLQVQKFLVIPTKFYSTLLGLHYDEEEFQDEDYEMESEDEEYDEENEEDKYDKMDENELAEIMGELHPHNVPNENNHTHIMFQMKTIGTTMSTKKLSKMKPVQPYINPTGRGHQTQGINT